MKKIAVVTATRAEYGILTPLIRAVNDDTELELELIVTGTHLIEKYGYTLKFIEKDGFPIAHKIPILEAGNTPYDISITMANAIRGFAECFRDDRPDMVVILGDRTEMLGIAAAAMNERIPIAHLHGGEVTEGAVDDCVRHALSKMSYLHFTSTEVYRNRVVQLGEAPERVFFVGALSTENILKAPLLSETELRKEVGIPEGMKYSVVTFHPVTLEADSAKQQTLALCEAMEACSDTYYLITMANADTGGDIVNKVISEFADKHDNIQLVSSLGMTKYLSAVKYSNYVLGNSSSGIIEAPVLGVPTVNIGDRQKGRLMAETVINCEPDKNSILNAINKAEKMEHHPVLMYGDGTTSKKIVSIIKDTLMNNKVDLKKCFYDMKGEKCEN
ncbi:MAG: UDP-N-acetylglucosamine 2-epimerase (hydrolyzing) [Ruminococcus sp.]|uniref:UDP-N-acetylglucosamine 2-epimerase n=1 Tax=Ruminococcus sp. TaxID=41978 RepID=UPI001B17681C|nr:UDP-N-acetylglucosamine 2-epimerase [Ruminococcus sp.]MBO7474073.1 UDP-N-acetylglucosamine 2-epimerase (hydrolyzing) [Ruminococcus sp.]